MDIERVVKQVIELDGRITFRPQPESLPPPSLGPAKSRGAFIPSPPAQVSHVLSPPDDRIMHSPERETVRRRSDVTNSEAALRAVTAALAMGAVLIAALHAVGVPALVRRSVPAVPVTRALPRDGSPQESLLLELASTYGRLVVPPARAYVYEAGEYESWAAARKAQAEDKKGGVVGQIGGKGPYVLLVGTYDGLHRDRAFESYLQKAEIPYYMQVLRLGGRALLWPAPLRRFARPLEERFLDDIRIIKRLANGQTAAALAGYRLPMPSVAQKLLRLQLSGLAAPFLVFDEDVTAALGHAAQRRPFVSGITAALAELSRF